MKKAFIIAMVLMLSLTGSGYIPVSLDGSYGVTNTVEAKGSRSFSRPSARPSVRPSSKPASKPAAQPAQRPASKPAVRPDSKPSVSQPGKPTAKTDTAAASAAKRQASAVSRGTAPKSTYTTPSGKTVNIDKNSPSVQSVRGMSADKYNNRTTRIEHHYHSNYGDRYDYYRSQPSIYVGGGYSALFWYAMLDWSIDRQAMWFYHNQRTIDQNLYQQQLAQNAQLKAQIAQMQASGVPVNQNYVDSQFKDNEDLMYSNEFVTAAYNPQTPAPAPKKSYAWLCWTTGFGVIIIAVIVYFFFFYDPERNR